MIKTGENPPVLHWLQRHRPAWLGLLIVILAGSAWIGWHRFIRPTDAQLLTAGIRFTDRGQKEQAIEKFDQLLQRNPHESMALLYRGQLARDAGDVQAATEFWKRVPDEPAHLGGTARFLEGTLLLEANRARAAEAAFLKAIELNPKYVKSHERLLKLYAAQLRPPDIKHELDAIHQFRPWTLDELYELVYLTELSTNKAKTIPLLEKFVKADPDDLNSALALARYYLRDDRAGEAAGLLRRAAGQNPKDATTQAYLAEALLAQWDLPGASEALSRAPAEPGAPQCVWKSHGLFWIASGDWKQGAVCLEKAFHLNPNDMLVCFKFGLAMRNMGEAPAAKRYFRRVERLKDLRLVMIEIAERAENETSPPVEKVFDAGRLLVKLDRNQEAAAFFEQVLAWRPDDATARDQFAQASRRSQSSAANDGGR
ncbi:MAG TPA: tetratricopeptide repeat protein [Planctomycetaceae bacterium]|nr:tetratricopeptide repeat protein [Planctomycetaceae bacterium]